MTVGPGGKRRADEDEVESTVLVDVANGVATISLNRPARLNAINAQLVGDLHQALRAALARTDVGSILLRGEGRAFCAGDDLTDIKGEFADADLLVAMVDQLQDISRLIVLGPKPVVAAVHGWAVGGGLEWALNCDVILFAESACGFFPEVRLGLAATGGATLLLPALVGPHRARELLYFGREFTAAEAAAWGMISATVPDDQLMRVARSRAEQFCDLPGPAVRELKSALGAPQRAAFELALVTERDMLLRLAAIVVAGGRWPEIKP
ncbi:MAG: enoyl-CoA hydratase/isomerase family protein [Caulobacter sp.]|nr:enoyl-CoA hydratase/isomerase family protein [Caulobacter sp.]